MALVDSSEQRWRELAVRLVADTEMLERQLDGGEVPSLAMGATLLEAGRLLGTRLEQLATRLGVVYSPDLEPVALDQLRAAVAGLRTMLTALAGVPEALDPQRRR